MHPWYTLWSRGEQGAGGGTAGKCFGETGKDGVGGQQLGNSASDHGFRLQQLPSFLCTHSGHSQGPCAAWLQAAPQCGAAGYPIAEGRGESCMQANQHSHLASSGISALLSAPFSHQSPFPATG